jgi:hypothetical protein
MNPLTTIGAIIANILLILFHSVAYIFSIFSDKERRRHAFCVGYSANILYNWARGTGDAVRFHHRDYGNAAMILPGRTSRFGKWMVFDDVIGYDSLGIMQRQTHQLYYDQTGAIQYGPLPVEHWPIGATEPVLITKPTDGILKLVGEGYHPSDNYFVKHKKEILDELIPFSGPTPQLDAIDACRAKLIAAIKPLLGDQMNIDIDSLL